MKMQNRQPPVSPFAMGNFVKVPLYITKKNHMMQAGQIASLRRGSGRQAKW
jgi:hypothetical protein